MRCFVYGLVDPETRLIFYVGQSTVGMGRPRSHLRRGWTFDIVVLEDVAAPRAPAQSLCPWLPEGRNPTALHEAERWWIAYGRACGWPLRNQTIGGEGTCGARKSPEQRARNAAATRRQFADPVARARFSEAQRSRPRASQETRDRIANASRGRRMSSESIAKRSLSLKASWTPERRERQCVATRKSCQSRGSRQDECFSKGEDARRSCSGIRKDA